MNGTVPRAALEAAAKFGGPTMRLVTNQTQAPAIGRGLSVAIGQNAIAVAGAARDSGRVYVAEVPKALVYALQRAGLASESITGMQMGGVVGTEIRFSPAASEFLVPFFK